MTPFPQLNHHGQPFPPAGKRNVRIGSGARKLKYTLSGAFVSRYRDASFSLPSSAAPAHLAAMDGGNASQQRSW
jgi:hypothetical protein